MKKSTKIFLIISLLILVAGLVFLYYFLAKPEQKEQKPIQKKPAPTEQIETEEKRKLIQITDRYLTAPFIDEKNNKIRYIAKSNGLLYETDLEGKNESKIPFVGLGGLVKTIWSDSGDKFINIYSDAFGIKRFFYDLKSKKTEPLNKNITWVAYMPKTDKLAYHYYDSFQNINSIAISDPDGKNAKSILNTRLKDVRLRWINEEKISISTAPSGLAQNILYYTDINNPKMIKVLSDIYGLTYKWSENGSKIIFSQTDEKGKNLKLMSANGSGLNITDLKTKTLPEKCVFLSDNINVICAEPQEIPQEAIMPDDYYKKLVITNDTLWKINTETSKKDMLYSFAEDINFDVSELYLTKDEKYLYFINRTNGFLYRLEL